MLLVGNIGAARWSGSYFNSDQNPLVHLWSLSVEEQFYIFIPIMLLLLVISLKKFRSRNLNYESIYIFFIFLVLLGSILLFLDEAVNVRLSKINIFGFNFAFSPLFSFYAPWQRIWEFAFGSIAFIIWTNRKRAHYIVGVILMVLLLLILNFPLTAIDEKSSTLIVCFLTATIITVEFNTLRSMKIERYLEKLGDYSYSIYLIHLPLIYIFSEGFLSRVGLPKTLCILMSLVLSVTLGAFNYAKVERLLRAKDDPRDQKNLGSRGFITIGLLITAFASLIIVDVGSNSHYWGLDKNIKLPTPAGYMGRNKCATDTSFGEPCLFRSISSKGLIFLIGDSHAAELSQVVKGVSLENNFTVAIGTHSGFPIALSPNGTSRKYNTQLAYSNTQSTLDYIKSNHPTLVIISMNYAQWEKSETERAILEIKSMVPNVLIINQTPTFTDVAFMRFLSFFDKPYAPPPKMKLSSVDTRSLAANTYMAKFSEENDIPVLNPWPIFCDSIQCTRYEKNQWLYYDLHHLTIYGANKLRPLLTKEILSLRKSTHI